MQPTASSRHRPDGISATSLPELFLNHRCTLIDTDTLDCCRHSAHPWRNNELFHPLKLPSLLELPKLNHSSDITQGAIPDGGILEHSSTVIAEEAATLRCVGFNYLPDMYY